MRIIVAPDSFKESFSAKEVAKFISKGILKVLPQANIKQMPISDGGEGLLDALIGRLHGKRISVPVKDPLLRDINAVYGILQEEKTAIIEMAKASGLELLGEAEKNPMRTSSFGTGQLIKDALNKGCKKIIIGIGGSATNDGGVGMVQALGGKFLNAKNEEIAPGGGALMDLVRVDLSHLDYRLQECKIEVACDVSNSLTGKDGATLVYGGQKGGSPEQLKILEKNMIHYASVISKKTGIEIAPIKGSGAAGGMGAGLIAFLNAELKSGIDYLLKYLEFEKYCQNTDLIITGEGKMDSQTLQGKSVFGIAAIAKKYNVPVIVITGNIGEDIEAIYDSGVTAVFSVINQPMDLNTAIKMGGKLIQSCVENIMRTIKQTQNIEI